MILVSNYLGCGRLRRGQEAVLGHLKRNDCRGFGKDELLGLYSFPCVRARDRWNGEEAKGLLKKSAGGSEDWAEASGL